MILNPYASSHLNIVLEAFRTIILTIGELCDASTHALQPQVKRAHGRIELITVGEGFIEAKKSRQLLQSKLEATKANRTDLSFDR